MYNNLLFAVKKRILDELVLGFDRHPAFSKKIRIYHKFPYEKRLQYGIVLRNSSGAQIRMSADNYLAELKSHVRLVRIDKNPGLAIEWVRENVNTVTTLINEDVSNQVGSTQRRFFTTHQIVKGFGDTRFADNIGEVKMTINGEETTAQYVDGKSRTVMMKTAPGGGDIVRLSYYYRTIANPGIYVIDFIEKYKFLVAPVFIVEDELVIEKADGTETSAFLANGNIYPTTEDLYMVSKNGGNPIYLVRGTDYTINNTTGEITLLIALEVNFDLRADYRWQPTNYFNGPYEFKPYQEVHNAIPGVVLSIGRRSQADDRQGVIVEQNREPQAKIYGGHWDMSLSLGVISKDPVQMEEMTDHVVNTLWGEKKNILEREGITLNSVEPTGESEESFIDTTGDLYYESSVDISVMTEWQQFLPYFFKIRRINIDLKEFQTLGIQNYLVAKDNSMTIEEITSDMRKVVKFGVSAYERVI